jgi:AcrR family transcriptional regulator
MSTTPTKKELTHDRIVETAAQAIRRHGFAGVGVADVMKQAGLTHGGFYAHFASRDALLCEALDRAGRDSAERITRFAAAREAKGASPFRAFVENYLADVLLASLEHGCPVAALASDMPRQAAAVSEASAARVRGLIANVARRLPPAVERGAAPVIAAQLVGALQLARALGDSADGRALLAAARRDLIARHDTAGDARSHQRNDKQRKKSIKG